MKQGVSAISTVRPRSFSSSRFIVTAELIGLAVTPGLAGALEPEAPAASIHEYLFFRPPPSITLTVVSVDRFWASEVMSVEIPLPPRLVREEGVALFEDGVGATRFSGGPSLSVCLALLRD